MSRAWRQLDELQGTLPKRAAIVKHAAISQCLECGRRFTDREARSSRRCAIMAPRFRSAALRTCGNSEMVTASQGVREPVP